MCEMGTASSRWTPRKNGLSIFTFLHWRVVEPSPFTSFAPLVLRRAAPAPRLQPLTSAASPPSCPPRLSLRRNRLLVGTGHSHIHKLEANTASKALTGRLGAA